MSNLKLATSARWETPSSPTTYHLVPMGLTTCAFSPFLSLSRTYSFLFRYLHLGFKAPDHAMTRERVRVVWAILRQRHPLLAAAVEMHDYDDVRFV